MNTINERLADLRKRLGLSLSKFGAPIGYHKATVSRIERGLTPYVGRADDRYILAVSRAYNISERWLRTGEGEIDATVTPAESAAARTQLVIGMFRELSPESQALILDLAKALIEEDKTAKKKAADPPKENDGLEEGA